jgi:flagellar basal body P-ring protein FlgI
MIAWIMNVTGLSSIFVWLIVAGIAVAGMFGYGALQHHNGYEQAKTEYTLQIQTMKLDYANALNTALERQSKANEIAKTNEAQQIIKYEAKIALRDKILKEIEDANVSNSSDCSLSADSVRRLDSIE